jgi:hypothetical protein
MAEIFPKNALKQNPKSSVWIQIEAQKMKSTNVRKKYGRKILIFVIRKVEFNSLIVMVM